MEEYRVVVSASRAPRKLHPSAGYETEPGGQRRVAVYELVGASAVSYHEDVVALVPAAETTTERENIAQLPIRPLARSSIMFIIFY